MGEAEEVLRIEEELGDGEVRAETLLIEQDVEVFVLVLGLGMAAGVARHAYREAAGGEAGGLVAFQLADEANQLIGMLQVVLRHAPFGEIAAQGQQAAHAGIHQAINPPNELVARTSRAGQVRQWAHRGVLRNLLNEGRGSLQPTGALGTGHRDVIRVIAFQHL